MTAKMNNPPTRAWNGGSPEAAIAAASKRAEAARAKLRDLYQQTAAGDPWRCTAPFRHSAVPGWIYFPVEDCILLRETVSQMPLLAEAATALRAARKIIADDIAEIEGSHSRGATGRREDIDAEDLAMLAPYDEAIQQINDVLGELEGRY
jgi:hypothetical protein